MSFTNWNRGSSVNSLMRSSARIRAISSLFPRPSSLIPSLQRSGSTFGFIEPSLWKRKSSSLSATANSARVMSMSSVSWS